MHAYRKSLWKPSGALAGLLIHKSSSFEKFPQLKGVGVKSVEFLDGTQVIYAGNALLRLAVAQMSAASVNMFGCLKTNPLCQFRKQRYNHTLNGSWVSSKENLTIAVGIE